MQSVYILFVRACYRPRLSPLLLLVQCVIFFALFANFYRRALAGGTLIAFRLALRCILAVGRA